MTTPPEPDQPQRSFPPAPPPPPSDAGPFAAPPLNESELRASGDGPAGPPPKEVRASFWLWIAGAVLSTISALLVLTQRDAVVDQVRSTPEGASLGQEHVDSLVLTTLLAAVAVSLVVAALYVLFAFKARAGRNWARVVLALLTGASLLFQLVGVSILGLLVALVGIVATVLLFLPGANQYFTAAQRRD
ncbi:hypothetical protein [Umezawaea beigongshangensis]|uniref:hypothetical protein n=1 Tax=Umezawaea beigongshangensis TaxID=2780383 RepID=UPI0018F12A6F|nr:hypothetical protein [Umezawaea beigongshangensis]